MADEQDDYSRTFGGAALAARLRRLSDRLDRDGTRVYATHGIRFEQRWYGILRQLVSNGPMTVGDIATALQISHASVVPIEVALLTDRIVATITGGTLVVAANISAVRLLNTRRARSKSAISVPR